MTSSSCPPGRWDGTRGCGTSPTSSTRQVHRGVVATKRRAVGEGELRARRHRGGAPAADGADLRALPRGAISRTRPRFRRKHRTAHVALLATTVRLASTVQLEFNVVEGKDSKNTLLLRHDHHLSQGGARDGEAWPAPLGSERGLERGAHLEHGGSRLFFGERRRGSGGSVEASAWGRRLYWHVGDEMFDGNHGTRSLHAPRSPFTSRRRDDEGCGDARPEEATGTAILSDVSPI